MEPDATRRKRVVRTPKPGVAGSSPAGPVTQRPRHRRGLLRTGTDEGNDGITVTERSREPPLTSTESGSTLASPTSGVSLGLTGLGQALDTFRGGTLQRGGTVPGCMLGTGQVPWDQTAEIAVVPR